MDAVYKMMQDENAIREPFNDKILKLKKNDNILEYVDIMAKILEDIDGITYLGSRIEPEREVVKTRKTKNINESRLLLIKMKFNIEAYDDKRKEIRSEDVALDLFFFKLINGNYFMYNGVKYVPVYQVVDKFYVVKNAVVLKTLLMGIFIHNQKTVVKSESDNTYEGNIYVAYMFKKKINVVNYYLAKMGFDKTVEYFGLKSGDVEVVSKKHNENYEELIKGKELFYIQKNMYLAVKDGIINDKIKKDFILSLINVFSSGRNFRYNSINKENYYVKKLGQKFTTNPNNLGKGQKVLLSFERLLDKQTKNILDIPAENKKDVYSVVKWMIHNYDELIKHDNMDLGKKRLRFYEYMLIPLVTKFSHFSNRVFNGKGVVTFSKLNSLFNSIRPSFLIKSIISGTGNNISDLIRYDNTSFNSMDMFSLLKITQKGPQSISSRSVSRNDISVRYRALHPSYIHRVSLIHASSTDPGMNLIMTPFADVDKKMYFKNLHSELSKPLAKLNVKLQDDELESIDDI